MAEIRFNYGDKFTQTSDSNTGIGSTIPAGKLDVAGGTSAGSLRVSGIATLSSYQGFVNTKLTPTENIIVEAGQSGSVSGEVVVSTGQTISVSTGATTGQGGIQSLKVYETFMPPVGGTADRPTDVKPGMVYYNKDFKTIEFWDGNFWKQVDNTTRSGRALFFGGYSEPADTNTLSIDVVTISTLGNATRFGEMAGSNDSSFGIGNETRGIYHRGGSSSNTLEYVTPASEGNPIDFGDLTTTRYLGARGNSSTRGIFLSGLGPSYRNTIDYVEMGTLGNALDFGDVNTSVFLNNNSVNSTVRVYSLGGYTSPGVNISKIEFVTISSKGDALEFDDLDRPNSTFPGFANNVRGIYGGGNLRPFTSDQIFMFNTASQGKMIFFGELTQRRKEFAGSCSQTRGVFAGGQLDPNGPSTVNIMDFITISSTGDAQDFGDLSKTPRNFTSLSDCHGGLGGF